MVVEIFLFIRFWMFWSKVWAYPHSQTYVLKIQFWKPNQESTLVQVKKSICRLFSLFMVEVYKISKNTLELMKFSLFGSFCNLTVCAHCEIHTALFLHFIFLYRLYCYFEPGLVFTTGCMLSCLIPVSCWGRNGRQIWLWDGYVL